MKKILIDASPEEILIAIVEDGALVSFESDISLAAAGASIVGNIYKGRIQNILPGLNAAFCDIGNGKNAYLYIGDGKLPKAMADLQISPNKNFHVGQDVMLQIVRDANGIKGPKATLDYSLPCRHFVLLPTGGYVGISHRIKDENIRRFLKDIVQKFLPSGYGLIIRTAAATASEETLAAELKEMVSLWRTITAQYRHLSAPALCYREADAVVRAVRDNLNDRLAEIVIDDRFASGVYQRVKGLLETAAPEKKKILRRYENTQTIFAEYGLSEEISRLAEREIVLPSGASITIDRTEAMTVIDVNSAKNIGGGRQFEDLVYEINCEAAAEIMRQLKLRDVGGIIVIDFIDLEDGEKKAGLLAYLRELAARDRVKTAVIDMTPLGLVEITRKRMRRPLNVATKTTCPYCGGNGKVLSPLALGIEICRAVRQAERKTHAPFGYEVEINPSAAAELTRLKTLENLAKDLHLKIKTISSSSVHPSRFNLSQTGDD